MNNIVELLSVSNLAREHVTDVKRLGIHILCTTQLVGTLQITSTDEMKHNVEILQRMTDNLEGARRELETINREQALLDFEETNFPLLQAMFLAKDPYDKLWSTALSFTLKSEDWLNGKRCFVIFL